MQPLEETIVAIATPPGPGAIGVIRISGPEAVPILQKVWRGKVPPFRFEDRRVYSGRIIGDQVLAFVMRQPRSYTGEDVVEIQAHGGVRLLEMILAELVTAGARLARPGEFTQRAFLNGKLDLAQAEGVADLINASTEQAVRQAARQLEGRLSDSVGRLRSELKVMRAQMEAMIDFPEDEDVCGLRPDEVVERVASVERRITALLGTYREGRAIREGIRVAIVGKPNAGKSSLLNTLLGEDRAIVHPAPGTTRDTVEEVIDLDGLPVRLIDTAGIRQGEGEIEAEGIRRTRARIEKADLVLIVLDASRPLDAEDDGVFEACAGREALYLYNKIDLPAAFPPEGLVARLGGVSLVRLSALTGAGLEEVKQAVRGRFVGPFDRGGEEGAVLTAFRHKVALEKGLSALGRVRGAALDGLSLEFLAADLSHAMEALAEVVGEVTTDEILDEIFSKFCIGK